MTGKALHLPKLIPRRLRSTWLWLIVSGYLLRIVLMPITGQHDVMFMAWQANFITQGHLNVYRYLYDRFGDIVMSRPAVWAPYPYGFYALTSLWLTLIKQIGLVEIACWDSVWGITHPARMVFLLKLIYLPFDALIGYLLYRSGRRGLGGRVSWALWSWSPAAVYTPFMMGQNDVYATAFMVAGLHLAGRSIAAASCSSSHDLADSRAGAWAWLSMLLLGIGAVFKTFPLLLVPVVSLLLARKWSQRLKLAGFGSLIFSVAALPFMRTPTFLNGVLLNPEGLQLFREFEMLGLPVPLFLVLYIALLVLLSGQDLWANPSSVWKASLVVLASLFILVPTPLYWLIWVTPLIIVEVSRQDQRMFAVWLTLQLGFSILLWSQHRELAVALPIHLSSEFNVPNLSTATALAHPTIHQGLLRLWPVARSAIIAALAVATWRAAVSFGKKKRGALAAHTSPAFPATVAPTVLLFLGLAVNLYVARNLVSRNNWLNWNHLSLSSERPRVTQTLSPPAISQVTGVRLRIQDPSSPAARLTACLVEGNAAGHELACASTGVAQTVEDRFLYFLFDEPYPVLPSDRSYAVRVDLETDGASVTVPYSTDEARERLYFDDAGVAGSLDMSLLNAFNLRRGLECLILENIWGDRLLLFLIIATTLVTVPLVAGLYVRHQPSDRDDAELG